MAGLTSEGLEIKRLGEVVSSLKDEAVPIFQDLVLPDDVVDTSDSSTIGRLIGLISPSLSDLWEAVQELYWAFDPNSARGIALDNLVMYGGLTRRPASKTTATVVVWGNEGTFIPATVSSVRAVDNTFYDVLLSLSLDRSQCIGIEIDVPSVVSGTVYSIDITRGSTTVIISVTATPSDTAQTVVDSLYAQLTPYATTLTVTKVGSKLTIESSDIYEYLSFDVDNVVVVKVKGRTEVANQVAGRKEQEANTITNIATPLLGWDSVTNPQPAIAGNDEETDEALRVRFRNSKFLRAQNISDSLYSALLDLDGVSYVGVYENETSVYDPIYDLNGHSFKVVVLGGNPNAIANTIWNNKPLGIGSEGNTDVTIFDSQGFAQTVRFERPNSLPIFIDITLTTNNEFPSTGVDDIKSALVEYFRTGLGIGDDVIYSRLYTPINSVKGHQVDSMTIGVTASPSTSSNIVVDYNEIATINASAINITVS